MTASHMHAPTLRFLDFDVSEDADGHGSFDAMANVSDAQWPALLAEVQSVLDWAEAQFPGARGPLEDGALWDCALQGQQEVQTPLHLERDTQGQLHATPDGPGLLRRTLTLTLSGTAAFAEAFRDTFLQEGVN